MIKQWLIKTFGTYITINGAHAVAIFVALCCVVVPLFNIIINGLPLKKHKKLRKEGKKAKALVLAKKAIVQMAQSNITNPEEQSYNTEQKLRLKYNFTYKFTTEEGKEFSKKMPLPAYMAHEVTEGSNIDIIYSPTNPKFNMPATSLDIKIHQLGKRNIAAYIFVILLVTGYAVANYTGHIKMLSAYQYSFR